MLSASRAACTTCRGHIVRTYSLSPSILSSQASTSAASSSSSPSSSNPPVPPPKKASSPKSRNSRDAGPKLVLSLTDQLLAQRPVGELVDTGNHTDAPPKTTSQPKSPYLSRKKLSRRQKSQKSLGGAGKAKLQDREAEIAAQTAYVKAHSGMQPRKSAKAKGKEKAVAPVDRIGTDCKLV